MARGGGSGRPRGKGRWTRWVLVAYDVPDDRRRARLRAVLESFGIALQYSVFACTLDPPALRRLRREVAGVLRPRHDSILILPLCGRCGVALAPELPPGSHVPSVVV